MALKTGEDSLTSPTSFGNDRNSFGYQVLCRTALDVIMWWFWLDFLKFPFICLEFCALGHGSSASSPEVAVLWWEEERIHSRNAGWVCGTQPCPALL